jgi:hypothetical protein
VYENNLVVKNYVDFALEYTWLEMVGLYKYFKSFFGKKNTGNRTVSKRKKVVF